MASCDYLHCDDCAKEMDDWRAAGAKGERPNTPGYKAIYVGENDWSREESRCRLVCSKHDDRQTEAES